MKLKLTLAAASVLASPALMSAQAQTTGVYVSGGYSQINGDGGADLGAVTGRIGVDLTTNIAIEGEGSFGVKDDSGTELDSELGAFVVGKVSLSPSFDVFARAGATRIETSPGGSEDGVAYGAGGTFNLSASDGIRLDWTRHDYDVGDADAWSISYQRKF